MRFVTLKDGRWAVVARDGVRAVTANHIAPSLLTAVQNWDVARLQLQAMAEALELGHGNGTFELNPAELAAPLPQSPQWLDGSAFLNHGHLMERAFNTPPIPKFDTVPVMYQGASDDFLGPHDEVLLPSEHDGIDFEGEFGVVVGPVGMGATPAQSLAAVRLILQLNDWSLRALGPHEMRTGFGFIQAKPSTAFAPFAVTPDELGPAWFDGRVHMRLHVSWNGERFGEPHAGEMNFSFGELVAHAARSRRLTAGCIIGSGTVSNVSRAAGSACIAERRVIEIIDAGAPKTTFMKCGDRVRMQACFDDGSAGPFGVIDQSVRVLTQRTF